jgi:hypothetical protein
MRHVTIPAAVDCGGRTLLIRPETLELDGDRTTRTSSDYGRGDDITVLCRGSRLLIGGGTSRLIWLVDEQGIRLAASINRFDLAGKYDPGGFHSITFWPIDRGEVVVESEVSIVWLESSGAVRWRLDHGDLTCRVDTATATEIRIPSEHGTATIDAASGTTIWELY